MNWPTTRLRYVADLNPGIRADLLQAPDVEVSFLPMDAIGEDGTLDLSRNRAVAEVRNGYSYFEEGDIAFAKVTPCFENGKGALMRGLELGAGFGTTEITVLRPKVGTEPRFLNYVLRSEQFRQNGVGAMTGAGGLKRVPDEFTRDFKTPWPTPAEQERIANFLDEQTARIDALIAEKERLQERLSEYRRSLVSNSVTQGVPGRHTDLLRHDFLGFVPKGWGVGKFRHYVQVRSGQVDPEEQAYANLVLVAPNHIESGTGRLLSTESATEQSAESGKYWCDAGDVIYSKIRPALRKATVAPFDCLCSADMYPLKGLGPLSNEYLFWYLLSEPFSDFAVQESMRVAMPKLNRETLADAVIPLPSPTEQAEIVAYVKRATVAVDNVASHVAEHIDRLREYRSSLISAAVTGQLDLSTFKKAVQ